MFFRMVYKSGQIFLPFCHNTRVWQTDGRTDGQNSHRSLDRVCITCSAVKICNFVTIQAFDGRTDCARWPTCKIISSSSDPADVARPLCAATPRSVTTVEWLSHGARSI